MAPRRTCKHQLTVLFEAQGGLCCYCNEAMELIPGLHTAGMSKRRATKEHLKRKCDNGTSDLHNLAAACFECNSGRGSIDWLTYKSYRMGELWS